MRPAAERPGAELVQALLQVSQVQVRQDVLGFFPHPGFFLRAARDIVDCFGQAGDCAVFRRLQRSSAVRRVRVGQQAPEHRRGIGAGFCQPA